jgi:hypothetical protein
MASGDGSTTGRIYSAARNTISASTSFAGSFSITHGEAPPFFCGVATMGELVNA